jgi:hypothetical protein
MLHGCAFIDCPCPRPFHRHHLPCRQDPVLDPFRDLELLQVPGLRNLPNPFHPLCRKRLVLYQFPDLSPAVPFHLLVA